jgi:hypothetical protein
MACSFSSADVTRLLIAGLASSLVACGGGDSAVRPTDPTRPPPTSGAPVLSRVDGLTDGGTATLVGRNLGQVTALTLDGVSVALGERSDSSLAFTVPRLRTCETDGRAVRLVAATAAGEQRLEAPLRVRTTASLAVGQSVLVGADTLRCLQLPAADQDFVLSVLNPEVPEDRTATSPWPPAIVDLLTFRTGPTPTPVLLPAMAASTTTLLPSLAGAPVEEQIARESAAARTGAARMAAPVSFDPAYLTAGVGDTVRFPVAYRVKQLAGYCTRDRASIRGDTTLSYPVQIAAVSDFVVVGVDLRMAEAGQFLSAAGRAFLQRVATAAAPYIVPAARLVFDPAYAPMTGSGSRHFVVITTNALYDPGRVGAWAGIAGDVLTELPQSTCALASETHLVFLSAPSFPPTSRPGYAASVAIHEFAHQAEAISQSVIGAISGNPEAWAVVAQDAASHLALRTYTQARWDQLSANPDLPQEPLVLSTTWGFAPARRLWDPSASYSQGALFLAHLREAASDTGLTPKARTLWQQVVGQKYAWASFRGQIAAQAAVVGVSPTELLDRFALASITDDLVAPATAAAAGLPQFGAWNTATFRTSKPVGLPRAGAVQRTLSAGPGGYDVAYLLAEGGRAVSLEFTSVAKTEMRVRLTRLR